MDAHGNRPVDRGLCGHSARLRQRKHRCTEGGRAAGRTGAVMGKRRIGIAVQVGWRRRLCVAKAIGLGGLHVGLRQPVTADIRHRTQRPKRKQEREQQDQDVPDFHGCTMAASRWGILSWIKPLWINLSG